MNDTIAAIASGITASGIGIIRISGPEAFAVLKRIFRPKKAADPTKYRANTIHYGFIADPEHEEEIIDECLVMIMRAPHTFTTEDTAEINCHGGPYVMKRILGLALKNGARPAEPGEFTKRAFLGGRIDLSEAEAVMDVISARSGDALKSSVLQLSGSVRRKIDHLRESIMNELAYIEAALDDPEHMDLTGYPELLEERLCPLEEEMRTLMSTFGEGRIIREGIMTVIVGKPNAGKSSLLNAMTGEDRAIVTDIEGTTRDILEEQVAVGGISLRVIDTAGIRNAENEIEQIGIGRARKYAEHADLILALFDTARALDENDREIIRLIKDRKAIILLNKADLESAFDENDLAELIREELSQKESFPEELSTKAFREGLTLKTGIQEALSEKADMQGDSFERNASLNTGSETDESNNIVGIPVVRISAREMTGLTDLENAIRSMFFSGNLNAGEETIITNARHFDALRRACGSLSLVKQSIRDGLPEDFYSIDLMDAYRSLSEIVGEEVDEDLVNTIFSKFCMGK